MRNARQIKRCLFKMLLTEKQYALLAYSILNPDDQIDKNDIETVYYQNDNELGLRIRGEKLYLIETSDFFDVNSICGLFPIYEEELSKNSKPEFYFLYDSNEIIPKKFHIRETSPDGSMVKLRLNIIQYDNTGNIFDQYMYFCRHLDSNYELYDDNKVALNHTIEECIQNDMLKDYLTSHLNEILDLSDVSPSSYDLMFNSTLEDEKNYN